MNGGYLHGYSRAEQDRLLAQNRVLGPMVHERIDVGSARSLVEIATGVGAQLVYLLRNHPNLQVTGIDISAQQLQAARQNLIDSGFSPSRFRLLQADVTDTGLPSAQFDVGFGVWALEHIREPRRALTELRRIVVPGGTVFLTEVFNQSFYVQPSNARIELFWRRMNDYQSDIGGRPNVGAELGVLLCDAGFVEIQVQPYPLHFDRRDAKGRRLLMQYWMDLLGSSADEMIRTQYIDRVVWDDFATAWQRLMSDPDAIFYYSFVQASARTPR